MTTGEKPNPAFDDLAGHALGVLDDEANERVLALLEVSPAARAELRELLEGAEVLGRLLPAVETPPGMKERLLAAAAPADSPAAETVQAAAQPATEFTAADALRWLMGFFRPARLAMATSAAALIVAAVLAGIFGNQTSELRQEIQVLETELAQEKISRASMVSDAEVSTLKATNDALQKALRDQMWLTYVSNNQSWDASEWLTGGSSAPRAHATIVVKRGSQDAVLLVGGLNQLRPGEHYQLWFATNGRMMPVASFQVDQAGTARVPFTFSQNIYDYDGAAVTIETGSNVPAPSAQHVLFTE